MKPTSLVLLVLPICLFACGGNPPGANLRQARDGAALWLTTADKAHLLAKVPGRVAGGPPDPALPTIEVDSATTYQVMDGFGHTLTGGSAQVIQQHLDAAQRAALLRELFADSAGIGLSYLRVSIGASDLDAAVFSYNDLPPGQTDPQLEKFSLAADTVHLVPLLKQILAIRPGLAIMGSPWSPPTWMKTNGKTVGGSLRPAYYGAYAQYLVKYILAMKKVGIDIGAITIQNEPENPHNNPSLVMTAPEQADFVKNHLGPAFARAGLPTKLIVFDHNCDHPEYPISILDDPSAKRYVHGSAFHLYAGDVAALAQVHAKHPDREIFFTEQWTSAEGDFGGDLLWHAKNLVIGAPRHWSRTVLAWNLAADARQRPHTEGGCDKCLGALTVDQGAVVRNVSYYTIAHLAKFVRPGSKRIASTLPDGLPNVAFQNPDGSKVLVVLNDGSQAKDFNLRHYQWGATVSLPAGSLATLVW
jgi:glucosylceramidase